MTRRTLALLAIATAAPGQIAHFRVRETAGLRRFGYPVRASIPPNAAPMQLLENGKPVPAQFTPVGDTIDVDFNVSLGPWETREYRVKAGAPTPSSGGIAISRSDGAFAIHSGALSIDVPESMLGLLSRVTESSRSYLRPGSQGLVLNYKDDTGYRAGGLGPWGAPTKATILKRGPLVCAVRFESQEGLRSDRTVKSVVDMQFPRSKSWVEVYWTVDDPERLVTALMADLNLLLEGSPALVDFGANDTVYDALRPNQTLTLSAAPADPGKPRWFVHLNAEPYATGLKPAEGWAHVMDRQRATAIAVADFGAETRDRLEVSSDGHLLIRRNFPGGGPRALHFWLHFVNTPVQVGAATSPQSMLNPLRVDYD